MVPCAVIVLLPGPPTLVPPLHPSPFCGTASLSSSAHWRGRKLNVSAEASRTAQAEQAEVVHQGRERGRTQWTSRSAPPHLINGATAQTVRDCCWWSTTASPFVALHSCVTGTWALSSMSARKTLPDRSGISFSCRFPPYRKPQLV